VGFLKILAFYTDVPGSRVGTHTSEGLGPSTSYAMDEAPAAGVAGREHL
jgi:hypothetical protein